MNGISVRELLKSSTPATKTSNRGKNKNALSISIVCYHDKKIYRTLLSNALFQKLGKPETIQISFAEKYGSVLIAKNLNINGCVDFNVAGLNGKYPIPTIGSRDVIDSFITKFGLDFSKIHNQTFDDVTIDADGGLPVAIIKIKN